ncbi:melanoma antigen recognized by T-cells 1-like isoform X1 [Acipenser ruthenus]|nr:melanoma antigen recognized by T-cells 1-like isoform X1 [Acipenser ruthenus]XP_058891242.1 melanoma antigen recognized by T-cells 1-like isoform X1 [Acipenser ruthenus]
MCDHFYRHDMPGGDFTVNVSSRGSGGAFYIRAEEAAGIALLVIILTILLIIGCWYYKRRNGYTMIRSRGTASSIGRVLMRSGHCSEEGATPEHKFPLNDYSSLNPVVADAPPVYEKISAGPLPPPYSP